MINRFQVKTGERQAQDIIRTSIHELLHGLGLEHPNAADGNEVERQVLLNEYKPQDPKVMRSGDPTKAVNIMWQTGLPEKLFPRGSETGGTEITPNQKEKVKSNFPETNTDKK